QGIYWGRGVGYKTGYVEAPKILQKISGTQIRKNISAKTAGWKQSLAHKKSGYMLTAKISSILEHGHVIWLTGCPASGKTTIANALLKKIARHYPHVRTQLLDGDVMRSTPMADTVGFTREDRARHILRMAYLAKMFADQGILVVCAFVSPDRAVRAKAKNIIGTERFVEVYVKTSLPIRIKRDKKGLYKKARTGIIQNLTGFNEPYEMPDNPEIVCANDSRAVEFHVENILRYITQ
ncbi:MAG: adenylyl-sulfate kinase, partial [Pseudomonadota bacterium]